MDARIFALIVSGATAAASRLRWYSDDRLDSVFHPHQSLAAGHPNLAFALVAVASVGFVVVLIDLLSGPVPAAAWPALLGLAGLALVLVVIGGLSNPDGTFGAPGQLAGLVSAVAFTADAAWLVRSRRHQLA